MKSNLDPDYLLAVRKEYGRWIRSIRVKQNLTQNELAVKMGISRSNIGKIENGNWNFGIDTVSALAYHLDFVPFFQGAIGGGDLLTEMTFKWDTEHPLPLRRRASVLLNCPLS
jgi:transcriptional regulator with XRE-family HTH domain